MSTLNLERPEYNMILHRSNELEEEVNSIAFNKTGAFLAVSCNVCITIIELSNDNVVANIACAEKGAKNIKFSNEPNKILHTTTKDRNIVRMLDTTTGTYISDFLSARDNIDSLTISHQSNVFATTSDNKNLRMWDDRIDESYAIKEMYGRGVVACLPESVLLAAANDFGVFIYDARNLESGPLWGYLEPASFNQHSVVTVSSTGLMLLVANKPAIQLFETDLITPVRRYTREYSTATDFTPEVSFNNDSSLVLSGGIDGLVYIYDTKSDEYIHRLHPEYEPSCIRCLQVNPKYINLCTTIGNRLDLWQLDAEYVSAFSMVPPELASEDGSNVSCKDVDSQFSFDLTEYAD